MLHELYLQIQQILAGTKAITGFDDPELDQIVWEWAAEAEVNNSRSFSGPAEIHGGNLHLFCSSQTRILNILTYVYMYILENN